MAKKASFVGSAAETKDEAANIARALADSGYRPLRWWLEFPLGSITLDRLLEIAKEEADGAVFLFTSADKSWYFRTCRKNSIHPMSKLLGRCSLQDHLPKNDS